MKVILLEKIKNLGEVGDTVVVKSGYARNYLIPKNKVLKYAQENYDKIQAQKNTIIEQSLKLKEEALESASKLKDKNLVIVRKAADDGKLYGSVTNKDIAQCIYKQFKISVDATEVKLDTKIKKLGQYDVAVNLHVDAVVTMKLFIARSQEEIDSIS